MASVKIINGALAENGHDIVLRGEVDPKSLNELKVDDYQREVLPIAQITKLLKAFETGGRVPDIELGMRGQRYTERDGAFYLPDDIFIIDGLQRTSAARFFMQKGGVPRVGCIVHFDTTKDWERERFRILNVDRNKLSPNVLARNMCESNEAIDMLHRLTFDSDFSMKNRICWTQRMQRDHLLSAMAYLKIVGFLHGHLGGVLHMSLSHLAPGLQKVQRRITRQTLRKNVVTFFDVVDQAWGVRCITFKEGAVHMRLTFLQCVAMLFSRHTNFWRGEQLVVETDIVKKLKLFNTADPTVSRVSGGSGKARDLLLHLMLAHVNSGKRTRRLELRAGASPVNIEPSKHHGLIEDEEDGDGVALVAAGA